MTQWLRVSPYTIPAILEDGKFKTQIETGTSLNAIVDTDLRSQKDGGNVVYGYLCNTLTGAATHGHDAILNEYGQAAIRLNESVTARTTFTIADSLYQAVAPVQFSEDALPENIDEILPYVEAQYHGGVTVADIAEVVFQVYEDQKAPQRIIDLLQAHGIACSINYVQE